MKLLGNINIFMNEISIIAFSARSPIIRYWLMLSVSLVHIFYNQRLPLEFNKTGSIFKYSFRFVTNILRMVMSVVFTLYKKYKIATYCARRSTLLWTEDFDFRVITHVFQVVGYLKWERKFYTAFVITENNSTTDSAKTCNSKNIFLSAEYPDKVRRNRERPCQLSCQPNFFSSVLFPPGFNIPEFNVKKNKKTYT